VARGLLDAGAHLDGGCSGTGPADVRAIAMEAVSRPSRS
jgi:S-methylmethionine-dependent homocysteine/selenocysteine methylase